MVDKWTQILFILFQVWSPLFLDGYKKAEGVVLLFEKAKADPSSLWGLNCRLSTEKDGLLTPTFWCSSKTILFTIVFGGSKFAQLCIEVHRKNISNSDYL